MKELYKVTVYGDSESRFEEYYSDEEIETITKFINDMYEHRVSGYDIPYFEFEKKE